MPTPTMRTKIALDGEKEYKDAIKNIDAGLKVLNSEMKLTSEQFANNADSVDALAARNDVLSRKIDTQKEKIETLKAALKNAAEAFGESDTRTMNWQTSLNNAEAELIKMTKELDSNTEAMEQQGDAVGDTSTQYQGLGDVVGTAADKLGVSFPSGAANAMNSLGSLDARAVAAVGGLTALAAAVVKVETALIDMTKEAAASADNILTLSAQMGLSTNDIQEFSYASELIDVSLDTLQGSLTRLTNNMQTAVTGSGDAAAAFIKLGISVTNADGTMRAAQDVFYDAIDALGRMGNATERDALSMDIFGKSAQDLNPLILAGSGALRELAQEAIDTGYVLDDFALAKLGAVDDAMQRLENSREAFTKNLSAEFAPAVETSLTNMKDLIDKVGKALADSGAVKAFGSILESVSYLLVPVGELISSVLPALTPLLNGVAAAVALIADTLTVIAGVLSGNIGLIKQGLGMTGNNASQRYLNQQKGWTYNATTGTWTDPSVVTYADLYSMYDKWITNGGAGTFDYWHETVYGRNASGTQNWRGGVTWVGENGPEKVYLPQGSQIQTAQESRGTGGDIIYVTIDAKNVKEFNDIVRLAQNARMQRRKEAG